MFRQSDLRIAKRTQIIGRVNFEFAAEALNVFNQANFVPERSVDQQGVEQLRVTTVTGTGRPHRPTGVADQLVTVVSR